MSRELGAALPYTKELEMPAMALPLGFVVSQEWGSLHVTQAASEAYAMRPPTPEHQPSTGPSGAAHDPRVDIWLIGPTELGGLAAEPEPEADLNPEQFAPASEFYLHDKGVGMTAKFSQNKVFVTQFMAVLFERATGRRAESLFSYSPDLGTGQPLMKDIEESVPWFFAHSLNEHMQESLPPVIYSRERSIERRQALGLATQALVLPPLAAGAAVAASEIAGFGELGLPVSAIIAAGAAAAVVRSSIKTYLSLSGRMENSVRDSSKLKAVIIGSRIEAAFKPQSAETETAGSDEEA